MFKSQRAEVARGEEEQRLAFSATNSESKKRSNLPPCDYRSIYQEPNLTHIIPSKVYWINIPVSQLW